MRFDSYDFTKYGTIEGTINKIAPQRRSSSSKDSFESRDNNLSSSQYTILISLNKNAFLKSIYLNTQFPTIFPKWLFKKTQY